MVIMKESIVSTTVEQCIFLIRGQKVILDHDLAELYGVKTKHLKRQVKRNISRFPAEFMFQLTREEKEQLAPIWHQFKTRKHATALPYAFTEHGIIMLSSVLNSERAIEVSIQVVRIFIKLRNAIIAHRELSDKLIEIEQKVGRHDKDIILIFQAINKLMAPMPEPPEPKRKIGFKE
jgi:phage regulator Rha-like protein